MNELFKRIPELTETQQRTINSLFTAYIFYKKIKRSKYDVAGVSYKTEIYHCVCTNCNESYDHDFENTPKHNSIVECPECNHPATMKHLSYGKKNLREEQRIVVFCPEKENAVWMRAYYASKTYNGDPDGNRMLNSMYMKDDEELTPEVNLSETARYLLEPCSVRCFKFDYGYYGTHTWKETNIREPFSSYMGNAPDYAIVSENLLENTFLRYIDIGLWNKASAEQYHKQPWSYYGNVNLKAIRYICNFAKFPIIESIMKAGFSEFAAEKILFSHDNKRLLNWEASKLTDFFKTLSKSEIRKLSTEADKVDFLKTYGLFKKVCRKSDIDKYSSEIKEYGEFRLKILLGICRKFNLNYTKAKGYLNKHNKNLQLWKDYLDMAKRLSYDLKNDVVLYPKALQKSHDEAAKIIEMVIHKEQAEKMKEITSKLRSRYTFEYGDFSIVIPETMQEIIDEGKALKHCVGGYAERHAAGKLAILFIRHKSTPDTPFVTMEVHGIHVQQVHGYRNDIGKPLPSSVKEFVEEFKKYIINPEAYRKRKSKERKSA